MKKSSLAIFLLFLILFSSAGCSAELPPAASAPPAATTAPTSPTPTVAPTPKPTLESTDVTVTAISEHTLKSPVVSSFDVYEQWPYLIAAYKNSCTPLTLDEEYQANIALDINITDWKIIYISPLHQAGGEMTHYIDLFVDSDFDPATKILRIDGRSLTNDGMSLYSFLIWTTDESGNEYYYYTRVAT